MVISAGELAPGQFVTPFEVKMDVTIHKMERQKNIFSFMDKESWQEDGEYEEYAKKHPVKVFKPWLSGLPFKVISVALPLVTLENLCAATKYIPLAPLINFDMRFISLIELTEDYVKRYLDYYNRMVAAGIDPDKAMLPKDNLNNLMIEIRKLDEKI